MRSRWNKITVGFASGALVCISGFVVLSIVSSYVGVGPWASALFICFWIMICAFVFSLVVRVCAWGRGHFRHREHI